MSAAREGGTPYLMLALAVAAVSFASIFVRLAQAPPLVVSFFRVFLASALLAPVALPAAVRSWPALNLRQASLLVTSGLALAVHFASWIASLSFTSIASSVLLVNTAPLFTLVLSWLFLGEAAPRVVLAVLPLALAGAGLIALGDWSQAPASLTGDLLAVVGAAALSVYHVIGRGLRTALPLRAYILGVWGVAALGLGLLLLPSRLPLLAYPVRTFVALLGLAAVPTLAGHGLVNLSLRRLPAPTVGLFLLGEPIGAAALAYAIFGERPGGWTLAGGVAVLAALAAVVAKADR